MVFLATIAHPHNMIFLATFAHLHNMVFLATIDNLHNIVFIATIALLHNMVFLTTIAPNVTHQISQRYTATCYMTNYSYTFSSILPPSHRNQRQNVLYSVDNKHVISASAHCVSNWATRFDLNFVIFRPLNNVDAEEGNIQSIASHS